LFFSPLLATAQLDFRDGYIITHASDTIYGKIAYQTEKTHTMNVFSLKTIIEQPIPLLTSKVSGLLEINC
ncbi:hypothetical protein, partial [Gloeocapsopsis sp. IPPAS B-1203]|uniref:hypothetical protein n=1 Tax=Gloeocapsopsis sp. IPPAS B-1203 TaxID=2049454 RepID=UPI000C489036